MAVHKRCSSTPVLPRVTALTVLLEAQHMKSVVHRLFYIAKIGPEMAVYKLLTDHYEKLFHILLKHNLGESVSGLLLIYPSCVIHIIESTSEILYGIIQDLAHIQHSLLQEAKILVISHHVSGRLFPQWYFRLIRLPVQYLHDSARGKAEEMVVEDFLITLLKLGAFLSEILQIASGRPLHLFTYRSDFLITSIGSYFQCWPHLPEDMQPQNVTSCPNISYDNNKASVWV
ncbi:testis-expressed protein 47 isoform X2 [Hyperolius riggenbachi]|uniref:testis-expressed protein 47 isoform X2 n=1 Tax=Hyperolius riggenbachi TaxID=752182 RepID=UPI0035A330D1